jgi:histone acetyltransferase (RNA polymerase elongator complex component)
VILCVLLLEIWIRVHCLNVDKSLKQSGCEGISIGIDTMDDSIQKDVGRGMLSNNILGSEYFSV